MYKYLFYICLTLYHVSAQGYSTNGNQDQYRVDTRDGHRRDGNNQGYGYTEGRQLMNSRGHQQQIMEYPGRSPQIYGHYANNADLINLKNIVHENTEILRSIQSKMDFFERQQKSIVSVQDRLKTVQMEIQHDVEKLNMIIEKMTVPEDEMIEAEEGEDIVRSDATNLEVVEEVKRVEICGGILINDRGTINYSFEQSNEIIRCVWTVRTDRKSKVTFRLQNDEMGDNSFITLSPYYNLYSTYNPAAIRLQYTEKIFPGDHGNFTVNGPLVFVTFFFDPSQHNNAPGKRNSFQLEFIGTDNLIDESIAFSHYHYNTESGSVNWPQARTASPANSVVTFVINPKPVPIYMNLSLFNATKTPNCVAESLTILRESVVVIGRPYYSPHGPRESSYRYCSNITAVINPSPSVSRYIVIYKSTTGMEGNFQFEWKEV